MAPEGFWNRLHVGRLKNSESEVTCDDCGETFPCKTEDQRDRLRDGCPNCNEEEDPR